MERHIKPAKGRVIRDHNDRMRVVPDEGKKVRWDATWAKRLKQGDVVVVVEKKPAPKAVEQKAVKQEI